ncbi:MAG: N-acetyltransferase [Acidimicrobiales bacterium]
MHIRREVPEDTGQIDEVQAAAFGQSLEAELVTALRDGGHSIAELSLIAEVEGRVVGHVVCSRGELAGQPSVGLGPIGVLPELQGEGVGSALMHAVIAAADALGEPLIALLGSPDYYRRFGFVPSTDVGITPPDPAWSVFQVRTLSTYDTAIAGQFNYAEPFNNL